MVEKSSVQIFTFGGKLCQCAAPVFGILRAFCQASLHQPINKMSPCRQTDTQPLGDLSDYQRTLFSKDKECSELSYSKIDFHPNRS